MGVAKSARMYSGTERNLGDRLLRKSALRSIEDGEYRRWVLGRYKRGISYRRRGFPVSALPTSRKFARILQSDGGFQPLLEFYEDEVLWNF